MFLEITATKLVLQKLVDGMARSQEMHELLKLGLWLLSLARNQPC